jgi:hypothetical protein
MRRVVSALIELKFSPASAGRGANGGWLGLTAGM